MLLSLSTLLHGSLHQKLSWTFRLYVHNNHIVTTRQPTELPTIRTNAASQSSYFVCRYDLNGDGEISQAEMGKVSCDQPRKIWR